MTGPIACVLGNAMAGLAPTKFDPATQKIERSRLEIVEENASKDSKHILKNEMEIF